MIWFEMTEKDFLIYDWNDSRGYLCFIYSNGFEVQKRGIKRRK